LIATSEGVSIFNHYVADVLEGRCVVGGHVKNAVARHIKDLERTDWDFYFDPRPADVAIQMFPLIFKHTIGSEHDNKPFNLSPWQAFIVGSIFGWRRKPVGTGRSSRRFRVCYVSLGRKNGKSTLAAAIAILLCGFDDEAQAQVYIGATRRDQSKIIFDEAGRMCRKSDYLQKMTDLRALQINFPKNNGYIRPLGSDKAFDGLNPHCVIFDELHAWKEHHRDFYDTLTTGTAARSQPLRFTITTAGDNHSFIWKEENNHAIEVAAGRIEDDSLLAFVACMDEGDDIYDESNWPKSIPNLGISIDPVNIREEANRTKHTPQGKNKFARYYANIEVTSTEQAIDPKEWDACQVETLSNWKKADCITAGIDAGGANDLMALTFIARFKDGVETSGKPGFRYELKSSCYMDIDTNRDVKQQPWGAWKQTGKIKFTSNLFASVKEDLIKFMREHGGKQVAFDPWNMIQLGEELQSEGFQSIKIIQSRSLMHEPTSLLLDLIRKRRITHDGSQPVFRWALGNLVINTDANNRWMPDKKQSGDKIDPVVAGILALRLASLAKQKPRGAAFVS